MANLPAMNKRMPLAGLLLLLTSGVAHGHAIQVHGHRGARARRPENTLPAFEYALESGVDVLELDLGITRDGAVVVSHDRHVSGEICLDPRGARIKAPPLIHSLTLAEIRKFDCGTLLHPRFAATQKPVPGTRIPTLTQVFELVKGSKLPAARKVLFNIETKIDPAFPQDTVGPGEFVAKVHDVVKRSGMLKRVILQSFDYRTLREWRKLEPEGVIAALTEKENEDWIRTVLELRADILSPDARLVTLERVQAAHDHGAKVIPWTANDATEWRKLLDARVDGIISDDPAELIAFLKRQP
jgi:glycerophosphoryl diester phosphodiesterase